MYYLQQILKILIIATEIDQLHNKVFIGMRQNSCVLTSIGQSKMEGSFFSDIRSDGQFNRFYRKRDESNKSKRSTSKESKEHTMKIAYIRTNCTQIEDKKKSTPPKRESTPVKSTTATRREIRNNKLNTQIDIEKDLFLHELQRNHFKEKDQRIIFQKKSEILQKELAFQINKNNITQNNFNKLLKENEEYKQKVKLLEKILNEKDKNLSETKNAFNVLKGTISKHRQKELQIDITKLNEVNRELNEKIEKLNKIIQNKTLEHEKTLSELQEIRQEIKLEQFIQNRKIRQEQMQEIKKAIQLSKSERELILEQTLTKNQELMFKINRQNKSLLTYFNVMNIKKQEQIDKIKEKKNAQIKQLRQKVVKLSSLLRQNRMNNHMQTDENFIFELTPQHY